MAATFFVWADRVRPLWGALPEALRQSISGFLWRTTPGFLRRAVPEFLRRITPVDHTWVTTYQSVSTHHLNPSAGDYWHCHGFFRATPPENPAVRLLRQGTGDIEFARYIARPNAPDEDVGLRYGVDGVCHQMANRILSATGGNDTVPLTVKGAEGYTLSVAAYGVYGGKLNRAVKRRWAKRKEEWKRQRGEGKDYE